MSLKGPEIRTVLNGKVDPAVIHCFCALAEELAVRKQAIMEIALLVDKCIDNVALMISVNHGIKTAMEDAGMEMPDLGNVSAVDKVQSKESNVKSEDMSNG